jgi:hypothetical protein
MAPLILALRQLPSTTIVGQRPAGTGNPYLHGFTINRDAESDAVLPESAQNSLRIQLSSAFVTQPPVSTYIRS